VSPLWAGQVQFVSVLTTGSTPELASPIVAEHGFTVPVVIDEADALWGPLGIPNFVLLDADGKVIAGISGSQAGEPWDLNTMLQRGLP